MPPMISADVKGRILTFGALKWSRSLISKEPKKSNIILSESTVSSVEPQQWTSKSIDSPTSCEEKPTYPEAQSRHRQASQGIPHFRQSHDPKRHGTSYQSLSCVYQPLDPINFGEEDVPKNKITCHRPSRHWAAANLGPTVLPPDQQSPIRIYI